MKTISSDITELFGIGANILNLARSLGSISWDLKLLALNGIVQAAKTGKKRGQSLITLSGFLSGLPSQIAPELLELEAIATQLSRQTTYSTMTIRRNNVYKGIAKKIFLLSENAKQFDYKKSIENKNNKENINRLRLSDIQKQNLEYLSHFNNDSNVKINELLEEAIFSIRRAKIKIEKVQRHGFSATYMGSCLSIEAAYLTDNKANFIALVDNIKSIIERLDGILEQISLFISSGEKILLTYKN